MVLTVKPQFLLLPHTQTVSAGIRLANDETFALDDWRREHVECQLDRLLNERAEVADEFLEREGLQSSHQISGQFVIALLGPKALDIVLIRLSADEVLAVVQPSIQLSKDL